MDWFIWLFVGLSVLFIIVPAFFYLNDEKDLAIHLFVGWWGGVMAIVIITAAMTFIIKPILNWGFSLVNLIL